MKARRFIKRSGAVVLATLLVGQLLVLAAGPSAAATTVLYRVNAGGPSVSGTPAWGADTTAAPSPHVNSSETNTTYSKATSIDTSHPSVPAGTPAALFTTERYDNAGGANLKYSFPVPAGQDVEVRLYFAEIWSGGATAGARVFDVNVDGALRIAGLDVFAEVGANTGYMENLPVISDGVVDIEFVHQVQNPAVKAIEILTTDDDVPPSPGVLAVTPSALGFGNVAVGSSATQTVTLANAGSAGDDDIVVSPGSIGGSQASEFASDLSSSVTLSPGEQSTVVVTFSPTAPGGASATLTFAHDGSNAAQEVALSGTGFDPPTGGQVLHRVNSGGPSQSGDPAWAVDTTASPSQYVNSSQTNFAWSTSTSTDVSHPSVPADTPATLFNTERYDPAGGAELKYSFPVPAGQAVEVRLYFAEIFSGTQTVGARVFDVAIDGSVVIDDLDVYDRVGANKGLVESRLVTSDGAVDIEFLHGVENPAVKGIEILAPQAQPGLLGVQPGSLTLPSTTIGSSTSAVAQLRNLGGVGDPSITVSSTSITGADAAMFSDDFAGGGAAVLAPGQTLEVRVTFTPSATGARTAALNIAHTGVNAPLEVPLSASTVAVGFQTKALLGGASPGFPTSIDWGPDGRLYVATISGQIFAYEVERTGPGAYAVASTETINLIKNMPNRDDDGVLNPNVSDRLVTGIDVVGTADTPVLYAVSSDPRIGGGPDGEDLPLDTNSGVLSRLTKTNGSWTKLDLVNGLPRSKENHTGNGIVIDEDDQTAYIAYGGNTNKGAPSFNFALLPEYALSAAILSVDLAAIGDTTYDLPTLDDEDRPGVNDANDPFGGNRGKNQAKLVPGGPVSVHSPGWRNPYDLVITEAGHMYAIDNGGNAGWGGIPQPDSAAGTCTNETVNISDSDPDALIRIPGSGYYAGHPNPTRANKSNTFNPSNPQSPVTTANPVECDYLDPETDRNPIETFPSSTNGLTEYTTDNFGGELQNSLLAASYDNAIYVVHLNEAGTAAVSSDPLFSSVGSLPLDVIASSASDPFPGVIVVADAAANKVVFFEPNDYDGDTETCTGADDPGLDEDGDGFSNRDEILNGTNPCSAADVPPDRDGDSISDLLDPDDDNDGIPDADDPFALDSDNGNTTSLPVTYGWENDGSNPGGLLNLGFTGHMTNGEDTYLGQFDPDGMTAGGAAGVTTVDSVSAGTAHGSSNDQRYGLQFGVDVDATTAPLTASTALVAPFTSSAVAPGQESGLFFGTGSQDDYVELVASPKDGGTLTVRREVDGVLMAMGSVSAALPGPGSVALRLHIDPAASTASASAVIDGGASVPIGSAFSIPSSWFTAATAPAVGMISTSAGSTPFTATWDYMRVVPDTLPTITPGATVVVEGDEGETTIAAVPVTLAAPSSQTVTVDWETADSDQPEPGTDFEAASGTVTFQPGETSKIVPVTIIGDDQDEPGQLWGAEWGAVSFSSPTNATFGSGIFAATGLFLIRDDDDAPPPPPPPPPSEARTIVEINSANNLTSSTYTANSFHVTNASTDDSKIASIRLDLSTSVLPDLVFDPDGTAGDTTSKDLMLDTDPGTGYVNHTYGGPHDDGFDILEIDFDGFDPGELLKFSVDVDPTSIRGASPPGPNNSGSVSGLELSGATVTVVYDDGTTQESRLFRKPASLGQSRAELGGGVAPAPTISVTGLATPTSTTSSPVTVNVTGGVPGSTVRLMALEGGLYLSGVPGGGFDIDPFEANTAVSVKEVSVVLDASGNGSQAIGLTRLDPDAGIWHFMAATDLGSGRTGPASNGVLVQYTG